MTYIIKAEASDGRYSNIEVTNKTEIINFNFTKHDNIVYINNILSTDTNNTLTLDKTNTTYIIQNVINVPSNLVGIGTYKKQIKAVEKDTRDLFTVENHNFKNNDIIKLIDIQRTDPDNTSNYINLRNTNFESNNITYKVYNTTRDTFNLITTENTNTSLNNISTIMKTSSNNIINGFAELTTKKSITENKIVNINIANNTTTDYGTSFNLIINDAIQKITLNTLNSDKFTGYINFSNNDMISHDLIEISDNKTKLTIQDIDLQFSTFEFINISLNNWYIKGNLPSNIFNYKLSYASDTYKLNNETIIKKNFYKNFVYKIDISDSSLINYPFIIVDNSNNLYHKNIIYSGTFGAPNSYIKIFIDSSEVNNTEYKIKYKQNPNISVYTYSSLYNIKETPIHFS